MAMVNVNNLLNIKDSRWLQLEVCREFQRNKCSRPDTECKFAHPPPNVEVQNGRVTACYDSIKGRCNREKPPCKYFHPPPHLKDQLLINGRNHLALKNALMQQMGLAPGQPVVPGQVPGVATNPYLTGVTSQYNPYFATGPLVSLVSDPTGAVMSPLGVPQQTVVQQKRNDRLESRSPFGSSYSSTMDFLVGQHRNSFSGYGHSRDDGRYDSTTYPGMVTYKRPNGGDKNVTMYQPANNPSAAAYQHLMQLQQPFVPVSSNSIQHNNPASSSGSSATAGLSVNLGQDHSGLLNGTLDSNLNNESSANKIKAENEEGSSEILDNGNMPGGKGTLNSNDLEDESKESAIKRMRVNNVGTSSAQANLNSNNNPSSVSVSSAMAQNNAAYVAAAQSYHNALAAMNYTGVPIQTNKNPQIVGQGQVQPSPSYSQSLIPQQGHPSYQQQQSQQQLIQQYQAMAAAAFAGQQGGGYQQAQAHLAGQAQAGVQQQAQANLGGYNPNSAAGFNQLAAAAAMNPYLASQLPQLAAAQRASLMNNQQQSASALAGAYGSPSPYGGVQQGQATPGAAFNPFGMQFGGPGGAAAAAAGLPFQANQQQALLAAYAGQFARGPVPVAVSAASGTIPTQQLYMGNPAVAAAAAAAAAANGSLQPGVKRMRPA